MKTRNNEIVSLQDLKLSAKLRREARQAALDAALAYYGVNEAMLRRVVFKAWLESHQWTQDFQPIALALN